jgi:hypothetical protein
VISLGFVTGLLVVLGVSWRSATVAAVLLGCLVAAAWAVIAGRSGRREGEP